MKPRTRKMPCSKCGIEPYRYHGKRWLCVIHFRYDTMRDGARLKGKYVPTHQELKSLGEDLIRRGMYCEGCENKMAWTKNGKRTVSLQHDRDGTLRFICRSCNSVHGGLPGDMFYDIPIGFKWCKRCDTVKPISKFYIKSKDGRPRAQCRECKREMNKIAWVEHGNKWVLASKHRRGLA